MKYIRISTLLIFHCLSSFYCSAQQQRDTLNVLFVGNSYVHIENIPHIVSLISNSTKTKLITSKITAGDASLSDHWWGRRGLNTKNKIANGNYDIVVLQEYSMGTIEQPDSFLIYTKKFIDFVKESGAQPFLYSTWARQKVPQNQEIISNMYTKAAEENGAGLVKVGEAWAISRNLRPDFNLFMDDGSHPSSQGALLTACVFVGTFCKELPNDLLPFFFIEDAQGEMIILSIQDPLDIKFCLKVASEITNE
jgi:hypothetical protein